MNAEFEEKEYEHPLYHELVSNKEIWNPGQVLEAQLGFDVAMRTKNPIFWKILNRFNPPTGVDLNSLQLLDPKTILPTFRCNLMLQAKRPEYLIRKTKGYDLHSPYYRVNIDSEQQNTLEKLAVKIGIYAYIGYACPAFHKRTDLFSYQISSSLTVKSSFVGIPRLHRHDHWAYYQPGTIGKALSEPEYVEDRPFQDEINNLVREDLFIKLKSDENPDIAKNLEILSAAAIESCQESSKCWQAEWFLDEYRKMRRERNNRDQEREEVIYYFSIVQLFCTIFNISWFVVG